MSLSVTACPLCSRNCGLEVDTQEGRLAKIRGDEKHPISQGYICQKAARLEYYQNHDDRLRYPLKRQPDGSFTRISWDTALREIAQQLNQVKKQHGGPAFAFVGGGGQGNHWGGVYSSQMLAAMGSRYIYTALAQEKTGDIWVNGRLFGSQLCHTTEDIEHADYVLFIGTNPFQAHGIVNARDTLKALQKDPARTMVVIDPKVTETAKMADIHLQLRPSTDAYLLLALLAVIVRENLCDEEFLAHHCTGSEAVKQALLAIDTEDYAQRCDVPLPDIERVARGFAQAKKACVRVDLGTQHSKNTTLNGYLEKLLYLLTGNFGRAGGNNLHTYLIPLASNTDERKKGLRTAAHQMFPIGGLYPPNILPDEINHAGADRVRAVWVDSANPVLTYADTQAYRDAFEKLELLVVVDIAMTETARLAHYVLPAASQFEKVEASGFNLEFPANFFHLRHPLFPPLEEALPEPEIYTRLLEKMGLLPTTFPVLSLLARVEPRATARLGYLLALQLLFKRKPFLQKLASSVLYRTLGKTLPPSLAAAAPLLGLAVGYATRYYHAVKKAGLEGSRRTLGNALFEAILASPSGRIISRHDYADVWSLLKNPDRKIHLEIPEMVVAMQALKQAEVASDDFPFVLMAGERRSYNANQIYRNPAWRKTDPKGSLRMHPDDALELDLAPGAEVVCESARGSIQVFVEVDTTVRRKMVTLPNGYGLRYQGGPPAGPELNMLTDSENCEPFTKTPYHKYVPVKIRKVAGAAAS
ncbi:MAG TPA: molybdopterin-dependent oxidoreductase [Hymenobacter sp.]|jgi:anaerobic selenocysteine-containing dehydrogenase|uniref:molybdopterin-dependent oxidoreductase n=1 Tax=Hymenobacter sp. TaxID=1898978 RepID=UPI002ED90EEB